MSAHPDPIDKLVGAKIRARRMEKKMSQSDLGIACGVTFQQIQKYEKGVNRVGASRLTQMGKALDCTAAFFLPTNSGGINYKDTADMTLAISNKDAQQMTMAFVKIRSKKVRWALTELVKAIQSPGD